MVNENQNMLKEIVKDKGFVICALVLLIAGISIDTLAKKLQLTFIRKPVPLKKSLQKFDAKKLYPPYKLIKSIKLESDIVEALGTKEYLQMIFEDTDMEGNNVPGKYISFFVTYYTGGVDQVPHVPDVCYQGGGYDPIDSDNTYIELHGIGLKGDKLPVRILLFRDTKSEITQIKPVIYFFSVNGKFKATRREVRLALADIRERYAYFSKVEIAFAGIQPSKEKAIRLTAKFLKKALPVLIEDHWQDWEKFTKETPNGKKK